MTGSWRDLGVEVQAAGAGREVQRRELPRRMANLPQRPVEGHGWSGAGGA